MRTKKKNIKMKNSAFREGSIRMAEAAQEPPRPPMDGDQSQNPRSYKDVLMEETVAAIPDMDDADTVPRVHMDLKTPKTGDAPMNSPANMKGGYYRQPPLTPGNARIPRIPSPTTDTKRMAHSMAMKRENTRIKNPHHAVRMTTVTMSNRARESSEMHRTYQESLRRPRKVVRWDEATGARPPLQIDMDGPSPCSYSTHTIKPLNEINSPAWSFGRRTFVEKQGYGARTSWEKSWYQNSEVWSQKVDFHSDRSWPAPTTYRNKPTLGPRQRTMPEYPAYSIGVRRITELAKKGADKEPSPNDYDIDKADVIVLNKGPAFTHQLRRHGTVLWGGSASTPGPGRYNPQTDRTFVHRPAFTICGIRREKTHELGPYASV